MNSENQPMDGSGKIYVDLDDVLCDTASGFIFLLEKLHGKSMCFDQVTSFDLARSFGLPPEEFEIFMERAHQPEVLSLLEPINGAIRVLKSWQNYGYEIHIVTGRPPSTFDSSKDWLCNHSVPYTSLIFVNKYDRGQLSSVQLARESLASVGFCFAVEDSASFVQYLATVLNTHVALFDRPWNRDSSFSLENHSNVTRCKNWEEIRRVFESFRFESVES
jgi:uncharacterized protein